MDKLKMMRIYTEVIQALSISKAGAMLGLSAGGVSRCISDLEILLNVELFVRAGKTVTPTEAGWKYYEFCNHVLSDLSSEQDFIGRLKNNVEGNISIIAPKWVGNIYIVPAIIEFYKINPKISVKLTLGGVNSKTHEFLENGYDICIQSKNIRDSMVRAKKIGSTRSVLAAAPGFLNWRGRPKHPNDLLGFDCLVQSSDTPWRFGHTRHEIAAKVPARFSSNSDAVLCSAALAGLGIALLPEALVREHVVAGELELVLESYSADERPLYAAYAPGGQTPRKVRMLISFLGEWLENNQLAGARPSNLVPDMPPRRFLTGIEQSAV